jgi:hypothetical protein
MMLSKNSTFSNLFVITAIVLAAGDAWGDEEWPGTLERPAKGIKKIMFVGNILEGKTSLKGLKYKGEYFEFSDFEWQQQSFKFSWKPGESQLRCDLALVDEAQGSFSGVCRDPDANETDADETVQLTALIPKATPELPGDLAEGTMTTDAESQDKVNISEDGPTGPNTRHGKR